LLLLPELLDETKEALGQRLIEGIGIVFAKHLPEFAMMAVAQINGVR
jgi:hypothetical protein